MQKQTPKVHLLLSGGIDSAACLCYFVSLHATVAALFVDYGQPAAAAEFNSAKSLSKVYKVDLNAIQVRGASIPKSGEIQGRNSLLISAAFLHMNPAVGLIALGIHSESPYFDCGPKFVELWDKLLDGYSDGKVQLSVPFLKWRKKDIVEYCSEHDVPLSSTWSCESSALTPCHKCLSCMDREACNVGP